MWLRASKNGSEADRSVRGHVAALCVETWKSKEKTRWIVTITNACTIVDATGTANAKMTAARWVEDRREESIEGSLITAGASRTSARVPDIRVPGR
jgi:hypothetical protein